MVFILLGGDVNFAYVSFEQKLSSTGTEIAYI